MRRNILLTTLGNTFDYNRHLYYSYEKDGAMQYCDGISSAEAGAKYVLSKVPIDKIIVLGPPSAFRDENIDEDVYLRDFGDFGAAEPDRYSEYKFFCYRIMQFLNRLDIEGNDLLDIIPLEAQENLIASVKTFLHSYWSDISKEDRPLLFDRFNNEPAAFWKLLENIPQLDRKQVMWLKHCLYMYMNRSRKMQPLSDNEDIRVQFVPTVQKGEDNLKMGNLPTILSSILDSEADGVDVYVDMQGMDIADSHTLISVLFMIQNAREHAVELKEIITTTFQPTLFTNPIEDQKNRLELSELLSGMDAFLLYGKIDRIREYWLSREIQDEHVDKLLYAMQTVDVGISLCNVSEMEKGIKMLKTIFASPRKPSGSIESTIFAVLENGIRLDYGKLLQDDDDIDILALIKWLTRKRFHQQALTIIESRIPYDMVRKGIFFYAGNETQRGDFLERMNESYVMSPAKDRYQFEHLDHYYIKFYRRREVYKLRPENPIETYVDTRLDEIYNKTSDIKSYTLFTGSRNELRSLILEYLQIGNIRNRISHAQEVELFPEDWNVNEQNEKIRMLEETITSFIDHYDHVLKQVDYSRGVSLPVSQEEYQAYRMLCIERRKKFHAENDKKKK